MGGCYTPSAGSLQPYLSVFSQFWRQCLTVSAWWNVQHADTSCFLLLLLFDFIVGGNLFCSQNSKMIMWITKRHRSQHSEYLNFQFQIPDRRLLTDCSFQTSTGLLIIFLLVTDKGLSCRNTSKWTQLLLPRVMVTQLGATPWGLSSCPLKARLIHF